MRFHIGEVEVLFPYEFIYPEQFRYMVDLKRTLDARGHGVLEMPSGTGKTITILSLVLAYQARHPERTKLIYCTRTVQEMEKVLKELQRLVAFRISLLGEQAKILAVGLSSRKNLCCHPRISKEPTGTLVDSHCRNLTATWVRERAVSAASSTAGSDEASGQQQQQQQIETCPFFEKLQSAVASSLLPAGVYTLTDLRRFGEEHGVCPYFLARRVLAISNVVVYSYQYLIDPKISGLVSSEMTRDCIVIFDEAHNIDSVCIEALSVNVDMPLLHRAVSNLSDLQRRLKDFRAVNENKLRNEYMKLRDGLAAAGLGATDDLRGNPVLPADILQEAVPGNIRRGEHFLYFLRRVIEYTRDRLKGLNVVVQETPAAFVSAMEMKMQVDVRALKFCSERLRSLFHTLEVADISRFMGLRAVADFATLVGTYDAGFAIIIEPYDERAPSVRNPVLQYCCLDAAIAMRVVFQRFDSVVITSGTLTPLHIYPTILSFAAAVTNSFPMTITRKCICPMIVSKGDDQTPISSQFSQRTESSVVRNYGMLLLETCSAVPDGVICFFTSYTYMEQVVAAWNEQKILEKVSEHKLIFIETPDTLETAVALDNYRRACDSGRGAVLLSIARGKVAEGIDFDGHYGRAVIMLGVPYMYTESRVLRARMKFMNDNYHISEEDFLTFDAMRQAAQCIGRVIRNKSDYGLMILADRRYKRSDKRTKLPKWINEFLDAENLDLSTDLAVQTMKRFLKEMSQHGEHLELGVALWDQNTVLQLTSSEQGASAGMLQYSTA